MSKKDDIRSWCHHLPPSFSAAGQLDRLSGEIYHGDKKRWELPSLIRSLCKGSIVEVIEVFLLASTKGRSDKRRRELAETVDKIVAMGAIIRELNTGHESRRQLGTMMARAYEMIGRSGRGKRSAANGARSKGRPHIFTAEQVEAMRVRWFSREYGSITEAIAAIHALGIKVKRTYLYSKFGPRNPRGS